MKLFCVEPVDDPNPQKTVSMSKVFTTQQGYRFDYLDRGLMIEHSTNKVFVPYVNVRFVGEIGEEDDAALKKTTADGCRAGETAKKKGVAAKRSPKAGGGSVRTAKKSVQRSIETDGRSRRTPGGKNTRGQGGNPADDA